MKFAIQVNSSPYQSQGCDTAYQFTKAALGLGHQIERVFFYHDGIYNGLDDARPPQDERPIVQRWSDLALQDGVDLVICISAAQRRGLLNAEQAAAQGSAERRLAPGFRIAGLGLWMDACLRADRFLIFGR